MANVCEYRVKVIGKRNACHATYGAFPFLGDKYIESESGTDQECVLVFHGYCKWSIDMYTSPNSISKDTDITIPENMVDAEKMGVDFQLTRKEDVSGLFHVEIWCNSVDTDMPEEGVYPQHFVDGTSQTISYKDMPREIEMDEYYSDENDFVDIYELYENGLSLEEIAERAEMNIEELKDIFEEGDDEEE